MSLQGMEGLRRALELTPDLVRDRLADAISASTFAVAQGMRALVPKDSGLLLNNITSRASELTGRVEIQVDAFYWQFLEYGTVKMPARPFIRPAAEQEAPVFERRLELLANRITHDFQRMAA